MSRILVIGATGRTGREVVAQLPAGVDIRALVRNPQTAALPEFVEVVQGDLTQPETLDTCLDSIDSVFLVWTAPPATIPAALEHITKWANRIVFLSAPIKTAHPLFQQPNTARRIPEEIERIIESSGPEWTFLRPGMIAANARFWWAPQIRTGNLVRWPYLALPTAPVDERDIAAVAVRALCDDGHARAEYILTGPQSLTHLDQISTIGDVIGRSLRIEEMSREEAKEELLAFFPSFVVKMLLEAWSAASGHPAYMTSTVEEVTGKTARPFREWVTDHASEFQA